MTNEIIQLEKISNLIESYLNSFVQARIGLYVFPCLEISSVINEGDFEKPNVLHTNIKDILKDTSCDLNKFMKHTVSQRRDFNKAACGECNYRDKCTGGCPGLALIGRDRDFLGIDDSVCTFFKEGYYEKLLMI